MARTKKKEQPPVGEGRYYPPGATLTEEGVNFALYSKYAEEVYLLLFDAEKGGPSAVIRVENRTRNIWHVFVHGLKAGQLYGYRVKGPFKPGSGLRFNENKMLLDPCAKALTGQVQNRDNLLLAYESDSPAADLSFDSRDNLEIMPRCIVIDDSFDWEGDRPPGTPLEQSIIYEVHVKGFTAHKSSKVAHPGTYAGFIEKIPHLRELGVTAVELLPVQEFYVDDFLTQKGLTNYWGYNTIAFFAPESSYSTGSFHGCQVKEFKTLVKELHKAGIEVIMDVVYNHTGEGNEMGPTISFKGIDNPTYYALAGDEQFPGRYYMNFSGCGNSINASNPMVIKFIADSLRYWVEVMHVDGFRFDLATVLGRNKDGFTPHSSFFDVLSQDPVLSKVKLIAEPWDLGTYEVGNFPIDWSEWNGRFRDTLRRFTKGDGGQIGDLARRFSGSGDLYGDDGRTPYNSINFVTCHDGFTLNDLFSFNEKHNEANLEGNRDGSNDNNSWNCGVEGETREKDISFLRRQLAKNAMATLLFSLGTPMILGGDEFLRTQKGNNNAYCQDNEISWVDWDLLRENADFFRFIKGLITVTRRYKALQMSKFFEGQPVNRLEAFDMNWYGKELDKPQWNNPEERTLALLLHAREPHDVEYYFYVIFNSDYRTQSVELPELPKPFIWHRRIDTSLEAGEDFVEFGKEEALVPADYYIANPRSTVLLLAVHRGK